MLCLEVEECLMQWNSIEWVCGSGEEGRCRLREGRQSPPVVVLRMKSIEVVVDGVLVRVGEMPIAWMSEVL